MRTGGTSPRPFACVSLGGVGTPPLNFVFPEIIFVGRLLEQPHVVVATAAELLSETRCRRQNYAHYWEHFEMYSLQGDQPLSEVSSIIRREHNNGNKGFIN